MTDPDATRAQPPSPSDDFDLAIDDGAPEVGRDARALNPVLIVTAFAAFALVLFVWLNGRRAEHVQVGFVAPAAQTQPAAWAPPPPLQLPITPVSTAETGPFAGLPPQVGLAPPPPPEGPASVMRAPGYATVSPSTDNGMQRRRAPAVVVDIGAPTAPRMLAQLDALPAAAGAPSAAAPPGAEARPPGPRLNESEQFAQRVGETPPDVARASPMRNPRAVAPQGTIIPGVLETAINSDLPGFTRAVVSRDVLSFDGKAVLIPRGSRLIGQYKSAVALGQSRAFIIWTRVIRPDGVSILIGSPGTDALGRGGLEGDVDRHFFRRFSGSILLSVLNAAVSAVGQTPSTQISIGSPAAASGLASSALQGEAIPPTIKVSQGEAIRIFLARDLDFSAVDPVR